MSAADEDELTGRADDSSGSQRSPELLPQPPSSVLVPAMIPAPPKTPSRSMTPEPFVRAGPTRPGASPKVLDVDSVSMNGANLGVESVWMAEVTASSEEFSVDVSLSTGVTIVVPHFSDEHDADWFAIAKDAGTRRRLLACFQPRLPPPSSMATLVRLLASPFAKDASTLAVLCLATGIALGVFGSDLNSLNGEAAAAAAAAGARRALGRRPPPPPPPLPARSSLALAGDLLPQAVKGVAFAAHGLANGLEAIVSNTYGHEAGKETSFLETVTLIALLIAFATRVAAKMQTNLFARTHSYYLLLKPCAESEALQAMDDHGVVESAGGRSLVAALTTAFRACISERREGNNGSEAHELKVEALLEAFQSLKIIGEAIGPLMGLSVKNDESNVQKVRRVVARHDSGRVPTIRALLEAEKASGVHRPGALLADPSAAMALLWMRRTMQYYIGVMLGAVDASHSLSSKCRTAYASILEPYHGWLLKNTFNMVLSAVPSRDEFIARLAPGVKPKHVRRAVCFGDIHECVPLMEEVVAILQQLFEELDLEDKRKS